MPLALTVTTTDVSSDAACVTSVGKGFHFTLPHSMFVFYVHPRKKDAM